MTPGRTSPPWRGLILLHGCGITLLACVFFIYRPALLALAEHKVYDSMLRALPQHAATSNPVVVDLDERSLAEFGQWPWPRYRVAQLLDKLNRLKARSVGLDILFAEADRTSLHILQQELQRDFAATLDISGLPSELANNDRTLARVLARGPFTLGYKFLFSPDGPSAGEALLHPVSIATHSDEKTAPPSLFSATGVIANIPELAGAVSASGFLNYPADEDGVLRRVPLLIRFGNQVYPSMALATIMQAMGKKTVVLNMAHGHPQSIKLGKHHIPVDTAGNLLLAFRTGLPSSVSASDILRGTVARSRIEGKVILVGTSATGLVDTHSTPLHKHFPGVAVHATVIDNILSDRFLSRPAWANGVELGLVVLLGMLSTFILAEAQPFFSLLIVFCGGGGLGLGSFLLLREKAIFLNPLLPVVVLFVNFAMLNLLKFWREKKEVQKRTRELVLAQQTTILSMTALAETRDNETGEHILRTQHYVRALAEHLATLPHYKKILDPPTIDMLFRSAPLHDIGKVGVADSILLNPGKLDDEDYAAIQKHTVYGYETLRKAESLLQNEQGHSFLRIAGEVAHSHHEKWDGSGYPRGLRGEEIPLAGRLMALADVYDALISPRRYKPAYSHDQAARIIKEGSGSHFDPEVVQAFLAVEDTFREISLRFADTKVIGHPSQRADKARE
ncbi:MAG: CHASE2 domain-containing protein [Desulfobulbaceae bacterium]